MNGHKQAPRRPDYDLCAMIKGTEVKGKVGAGWKNDDGSISVKLNPWVKLEWSEGLVLTLFPAGEGWKQRVKQAEQVEPKQSSHYGAGYGTKGDEDELDYMDRRRSGEA